MDLCNNRILTSTRREALRALSCGFGLLAFAGMSPRPRAPHGSLALVMKRTATRSRPRLRTIP